MKRRNFQRENPQDVPCSIPPRRLSPRSVSVRREPPFRPQLVHLLQPDRHRHHASGGQIERRQNSLFLNFGETSTRVKDRRDFAKAR